MSSDLVGPILVTLFCCLPFGIISIVYASQVPAKVSANDIEGAQLSANLSKTWMTWGLIAGVVSYVLFLAFWFFVGFAGAVSNSN
ncbi:MAG: CD225/dispanin family protein [Planctomycetota bacterium]|nr:CD225/dispanin family protein [Planctomycetota bacterium]